MRKRDVERLWRQLLAIHPNGKFWQDPKNREVGFNEFKKSLLSDNPLVGLVENEIFSFDEENSTTEATPPNFQPDSPPKMQTLSPENDATATANVMETLENSQVSGNTDSESEKMLDIRLKEIKECSRITKVNSKKKNLQNKKVKNLCRKQMTKHFKESLKDNEVENLSVIPKRPRGRPSKNNKKTNESNLKNNENGLKKFKFVVEYKPDDDKIVLLPFKKPIAAHATQSPLDLVVKPQRETNSRALEQETLLTPLDLSLLGNTQPLYQNLDEISNLFTDDDLHESVVDMPNLDNDDEFVTFLNEEIQYNEMQKQSVVPHQIFSSGDEICSDRQKSPEEKIEKYDDNPASNTITENIAISTKSLTASVQYNGSLNIPDKNDCENPNIANQIAIKRKHECNTQTEISVPDLNSMDYMDLCSEKDSANVDGGGIKTNSNKLCNEKPSPIPECNTELMFAWDALSESTDSGSDDDNNQQQNNTEKSIKNNKESEESIPIDEKTLETLIVSDLVLDTNETLDFEPDEDDVLSVEASWNGSDDELCTPPKKTKHDMVEDEKTENKSDAAAKQNEKYSFCLESQHIQELATSTPLTLVQHDESIKNSAVIMQSKFKIPKKQQSSSPVLFGKDSAQQQQQHQQLSRYPERRESRMSVDSSIPRLLTSSAGAYNSFPPKNETQIVDTMDANPFLRTTNSARNQQGNMHKWCQEIFGITCDRFLEGTCNGNCKLSHVMHNPGEIQNALFRLNKSELKDAYNFVKRHQIIFEKAMKFFIANYAVRQQKNDILFAINDCTRYPNCCEHLLIPIHDSLVQCGYTGVNACMEICSRFLNQHNIFKWQKLLDRITDLIMSSGWMRLIQYVIIIMNIPNYKLPPSHLSTILDETLWSDNIELIKKIIETLSMLDVSHYKENVPKLKQLLLKMQTIPIKPKDRLEEHNAELNPEYVTIFKDTN